MHIPAVFSEVALHFSKARIQYKFFHRFFDKNFIKKSPPEWWGVQNPVQYVLDFLVVKIENGHLRAVLCNSLDCLIVVVLRYFETDVLVACFLTSNQAGCAPDVRV